MDKQKAGIWYRDGSTVYLLQEDGSIQRDGYPELENKFYATVYSRIGVTSEEREAVAEMFAAAPETAAERDRLRKALEIIRNGQYTYAGIRDIADAALAGTPPPRPDAGQVNAELLGVLNRLRDGLLNLQENAKNRGDRYDVGYVGAMIEHATAAIAKAEEASQ
jgi:hypothetical protein